MELPKSLPVKHRKRKASDSPSKFSKTKPIKKNLSEPIDTNNEKVEDIKTQSTLTTEMYQKYPIFKNEELIQRFQTVPITNNQKGRIRQVLRDNLKGTAECLLPDVIHNRIQTILKSSSDLTDSDLRKIRILYNMLKVSILSGNQSAKTGKVKKAKKKTKKNDNSVEATGVEKKEKVSTAKDVKEKDQNPIKQDKNIHKNKPPKRYVVFVGNLPKDANKEMILQHFSELRDFVKDVRIPKKMNEQKICIAYIELENEPSYELALSKHHSMLGSKRINVLYTTQKKSKISISDAKSKSAKLIALQRSGKLIGSVPFKKKRSHRRKIQKEARAKQIAESA